MNKDLSHTHTHTHHTRTTHTPHTHHTHTPHTHTSGYFLNSVNIKIRDMKFSLTRRAMISHVSQLHPVRLPCSPLIFVSSLPACHLLLNLIIRPYLNDKTSDLYSIGTWFESQPRQKLGTPSSLLWFPTDRSVSSRIGSNRPQCEFTDRFLTFQQTAVLVHGSAPHIPTDRSVSSRIGSSHSNRPQC